MKKISLGKKAVEEIETLLSVDFNHIGGFKYFAENNLPHLGIDWNGDIFYSAESINISKGFLPWLTRNIVGIDKGSINYGSAWVLYKNLVKHFKETKKTSIAESPSLPYSQFYQSSDSKSITEFILSSIEKSLKTFNVYARVNFIHLEEGISELKIGEMVFRNIGVDEAEELASLLPERRGLLGDYAKPGLFFQKEKMSRDQFKKYIENKVFAVKPMTGFHIEDESSSAYFDFIDDLILSTSFLLIKNISFKPESLRFSTYQISEREPAETFFYNKGTSFA